MTVSPFLWFKLKDRGILMPYRTYRAAKKSNLRLSLVCAVMASEALWRQAGLIEGLDQLATHVDEYGLYKGVERFLGQPTSGVFSLMHYFQTTLSID